MIILSKILYKRNALSILVVVCLDDSCPVKYGLRLSVDERYRSLKKQLSDLCGIPPSRLLLVDVYGALVRVSSILSCSVSRCYRNRLQWTFKESNHDRFTTNVWNNVILILFHRVFRKITQRSKSNWVEIFLRTSFPSICPFRRWWMLLKRGFNNPANSPRLPIIRTWATRCMAAASARFNGFMLVRGIFYILASGMVFIFSSFTEINPSIEDFNQLCRNLRFYVRICMCKRLTLA